MVSGGYLFSRPRLPQCGKVVQRRRRSSNSLPYWISCSLHRPPDALTVDPITSPWLFDLARKIPTHQRPKKNTMRCMVFFFGIRRLPIFPGRHQPSIFGTTELNFRVRDGNGWTLSVINTNYSFVFKSLSAFLPFGDSCGNRTRVAGVRGRSLNRLTNEPCLSSQRLMVFALISPCNFSWCTIRGSNPGHPD